jgi:hypothetical protein
MNTSVSKGNREDTRMHVHIYSENGEAKFWLEPEIELARNHRFRCKRVRPTGTPRHGSFDTLIPAGIESIEYPERFPLVSKNNILTPGLETTQNS